MSNRYVRWVNIALGSLFLLPLITALIFYKGGGYYLGRMNKGSLITPFILVNELGFRDYDMGKALLQKKWTLLYRMPRCHHDCLDVMDKLLRVRLALGHDMSRTASALLSNKKVSGEVFKQLKDVRGFDASPLLLSDKSKVGLESHFIYVVDPLGNIMMRYKDNVLPKAIHSDLTRLLKVSKIG